MLKLFVVTCPVTESNELAKKKKKNIYIYIYIYIFLAKISKPNIY